MLLFSTQSTFHAIYSKHGCDGWSIHFTNSRTISFTSTHPIRTGFVPSSSLSTPLTAAGWLMTGALRIEFWASIYIGSP
jgi:hypothetical protein